MDLFVATRPRPGSCLATVRGRRPVAAGSGFTGVFDAGWSTWHQSRDSLVHLHRRLHAMGTTEIVLQYALVEGYHRYHPSTLDFAQDEPAHSALLANTFEAASAAGNRLWLGLYYDDASWWTPPTAVQLDTLARRTLSVARELASLHGKDTTLRGFYIPQEIARWYWHPDILAVQDGIGADHVDFARLGSYLRAVQGACARHGVAHWVDVELFAESRLAPASACAPRSIRHGPPARPAYSGTTSPCWAKAGWTACPPGCPAPRASPLVSFRSPRALPAHPATSTDGNRPVAPSAESAPRTVPTAIPCSSLLAIPTLSPRHSRPSSFRHSPA